MTTPSFLPQNVPKLHRESFRRGCHPVRTFTFPATDNIGITSGILVIINPEHNSSNDTIYVGIIQTVFSF
ncbi:carbohydrate porin [Microcoleus sp. BROC3]